MTAMRREEELLFAFEARIHTTGTRLLALAISYMTEDVANTTQMKAICADIARITGMTSTAVSRSLARAVTEIWREGNRSAMACICPRWATHKPMPYEFIYVTAYYLAHNEQEFLS